MYTNYNVFYDMPLNLRNFAQNKNKQKPIGIKLGVCFI
jgi:hypothetical protein